MKLKTLSLSNYRGFEQLDLEFCNDVTVIAGINGSGKSGVLKALRQLLFRLEGNVFRVGQNILLEAADVQIGKKSMSLGIVAHALGDKVDVQLGRTLVPESEFSEIKERIAKLRHGMRQYPKRSSQAIERENEIEFLEDRLRGFDDSASIYAPGFEKREAADAPLPVSAYYSVNRAFTDLPKKLLSAKPLSTEAAHENSLTGGRVNLNDFANWFRVAVDGELGKSASNKKLWESLEATIEAILPEFRDLKLERNEGRLPNFSIAKSGVRFSLNQLSDGERALLALAIDLTQRLSLANPDLDEPAKEGLGIVLIDEIELHLHPMWQQTVITRLRDAFPNIQFILTTHSPQVLTSIHSENIVILRDGKACEAPGGIYGAESKRALERVMGVESRPKNERVDKLNSLFEMINQKDYVKATELAESLGKEFSGQEPAIDEALTIIKNRIWEKEMGL